MSTHHNPNFPPPDSEDSSFSDPEIHYIPPPVPIPTYPPPQPHPRVRPNSMGEYPPQRIVTPEAVENHRRRQDEAKKAQKVVLIKRVLVVLAVVVGVLSWTGWLGEGWKDGLCKVPGMGPCVRFEERVERHIREWSESRKAPERRVGRKRGVQLSGDEDFSTIAREMVGSLKWVDEIVEGLVQGRDEMVSDLVQLSAENEDTFKDLRGKFKICVGNGIQAILHHKYSVEKVLDQSILQNTRAIERLEELHKNGPGKLWKWSDRFFGDKRGDQIVMQRKIDAEVKALTDLLEFWITSGVQDVDLDLVELMALRGTFLEIASIMTGRDTYEDNLEDVEFWKIVLRKYTKQRLDFDRIAAGLADTWVAVEDAKFLVADNVDRLKGLKISLEELKVGPCAAYSEDQDAIIDYLNLLKELERKLEQAKPDAM